MTGNDGARRARTIDLRDAGRALAREAQGGSSTATARPTVTEPPRAALTVSERSQRPALAGAVHATAAAAGSSNVPQVASQRYATPSDAAGSCAEARSTITPPGAASVAEAASRSSTGTAAATAGVAQGPTITEIAAIAPATTSPFPVPRAIGTPARSYAAISKRRPGPAGTSESQPSNTPSSTERGATRAGNAGPSPAVTVTVTRAAVAPSASREAATCTSPVGPGSPPHAATNATAAGTIARARALLSFRRGSGIGRSRFA